MSPKLNGPSHIGLLEQTDTDMWNHYSMSVFKGLNIIIWYCVYTDLKTAWIVYHRYKKKKPQACAASLLTSGLCVAKFRMGYFSGGLLRHVDLVTDEEECGPLKWHALAVSHSHPLSDNNNEAASGQLRARTLSHLPVLKECFRWVNHFNSQVVNGQRAEVGSWFWMVYWQEWILYFSFFIWSF